MAAILELLCPESERPCCTPRGLTARQRRLLELIRRKTRHGIPAVQRDLAEEMGIRRDSLNKLLARMRQSRAGLHALRPRIEATDLASVTYPHPAFGPLNFYQWLALIGLHEERHLRQIQSVLSA